MLRAPAATEGARTTPSDPAAPAGPVIGVVTLGCDKNTVDSERVMGALHGAGARVRPDAEGADVIVVNTCGFIDAAREESVDTILEAVRLKEEGRTGAVVAVGCMVQRYGDELRAEIPEVDLLLGLTEMDRLVPELRARGLLPPPEAVPTMERPLRVLSGLAAHTSHLKISEGCDHACAFCAIPLMRGRHRSTPMSELVAEARELERRGTVELCIVSQDTTWYGRDWVRAAAVAARAGPAAEGLRAGRGAGAALADAKTPAETGDPGRWIGAPFARMAGPVPAGRATAPRLPDDLPAGPLPRHGLLPELLTRLLDGTDIPWLRLFYMYPSGITPELVALMAEQPRILPYLDMPIQHGADRMLARMRRPERRAILRERVGWLRQAVPDIALRTTVILGFPGETDDDVEELIDVLEATRFDYLGAFAYSPEEGTPAAAMDEAVPAAVVRERLERVLDVQRGITHDRNAERVGQIAEVVIDIAPDPETGKHATGRLPSQAPEVDGVVYVRGAPDARPGDFLHVRLTEADENDLAGVPA
ncbi:MAG TPA: radical SAM protein [Longimicrobiales bacterium]|nr:radical SAM protein [Longimicrobiales bacterium]